MPGTTELEDSFATLGRRSGKQVQHIYTNGDAPEKKSNASRNISTTIGPSTLRSRSRTPFTEADTQDRVVHGWSSVGRASSVPKTYSSRDTSSSSSPLRRPDRTTAASITSESNTSVLDVDFWKDSFSSLQALASSALGSDTSSREPSFDRRKQHTLRNDRTFTRNRSSFDKRSPSSRNQLSREWGPAGVTDGTSSSAAAAIGIGSDEEQRASIQAEKRQELLMAARADATISNLRGTVKRGNSDRELNASSSSQKQGSNADSENADLDALVYVHHVSPIDNMTGVSIRYGCSLAVIRRSNGLWPSDSIQMRKVVLLPVDQCSIKGARVSEEELPKQKDDNVTDQRFPDPTAVSQPNPLAAESETLKEREVDGLTWKHESMVHFDGFPELIEIGRVPRRTLGYFPRARRKSKVKESHGDIREQIGAETDANSSAISTSSSPSRVPMTASPSCQSNLTTSSLGSRSNPRDAHKRPAAIPNLLSGPGGVGRLDNSSGSPGPGTDKLNEWVKTHLPKLQIPDTGDGSSAQENASTSFRDIGGAVESWFRKVAERAKTGLNELQQQGNLSPGTRRGRNGSLNSHDPAAELGIPDATPTPNRPSRNSVRSPSFVSDLIELGETSDSSRKRQEHEDTQPRVMDTNAAASRVSARDTSLEIRGRRAATHQKDAVIHE